MFRHSAVLGLTVSLGALAVTAGLAISPDESGSSAKAAVDSPSQEQDGRVGIGTFNWPRTHLESPDEPSPLFHPASDASGGPLGSPVFGQYVSVQVNTDGAGANIPGDAANEPSLTIDPTDPNRMVIGWRQFDTIMNSFRQAGMAYSHDGGATWTFPGVLDPGVFRSDPVLGVDSQGTFYYYSLTVDGNLFFCDLFKSFDGGVSWTLPTFALGGDKAWMAIDRTGGMGEGHFYAAWSSNASCCPGIFTRSVDGGQTFDDSINIPFDPKFGQCTVGPDGAFYVAGQKGNQGAPFIVARSLSAQDPEEALFFDSSVEVNMGGSMVFGAGPNPGGLLGQANIATDDSGTETQGNVYVLGSVNPPGGDPLDVMFVRSTDGGLTFSDPIRVNDDQVGNGAFQWFGTMSVAPNGRIDVVFNDTRDDPNPGAAAFSRLYHAYSIDGGETWSRNIPISNAFNHFLGYPGQSKLGDYYDMISDEGGANLAWAATFNGEQDVYFLRIAPDCNGNGVHDAVDVADGTSEDCDGNLVPDECSGDCNENGVFDDCDIANGDSDDCNANGMPDECEPDCNDNGQADDCDLIDGTSTDCNNNGMLDDCDIADGVSPDENDNGVPDECEAVRLFVDADATGGNNGLTWEDAFTNLQLALFIADGSSAPNVELWVAEGVYRPDFPGGPRDSTFFLRENVAMYGGFAGGETSLAQRDFVNNVTILSADLNGDDEPGGVNRTDNAYHVITSFEATSSSIVDGFTLRAGYADGASPNDLGAGMLIAFGNPPVRNCTFEDNHSVNQGGGVLLFQGSTFFDNCTFVGNSSDNDGGGFYAESGNPALFNCAFIDNFAADNGGGMQLVATSPNMFNCLFSGNTAVDLGGAIHNADGSRPTIRVSRFESNSAQSGGAVRNLNGSHASFLQCAFIGNSVTVDGGAIFNTLSSSTITGNVFIGNHADNDGGAIRNAGASFPMITDTLFAGNSAGDRGGAVFNHVNSSPQINRCTFGGNTAGGIGGAVFNGENSGLTILSSVLWANSDVDGGGEASQIRFDATGTLSVDYSCVQGLTGGLGGIGNIGDDPGFADLAGADDQPGTEDDDLRLSAGSPAINTGDPEIAPGGGLKDLDGHARVLCDWVDMGAYEFGIGDVTCDQVVDLDDHAAWAQCMTGPGFFDLPQDCTALNFNADNDIDLADFRAFQEAFAP